MRSESCAQSLYERYSINRHHTANSIYQYHQRAIHQSGDRAIHRRQVVCGNFTQSLQIMKRCLVCGARARGATCDTVCTKARKNGVSRVEQFALDMHAQEWTWRESRKLSP